MSIEPRKIYSAAEIVRETGIPQKELTILLEHYGSGIPTLMDGERRRFSPEAIKPLKQAWREYKSSVREQEEPADSWFKALTETLHNASVELSKVDAMLRSAQRELRKNPPLRTFHINALPGPDFELIHPIAVSVDSSSRPSRAFLGDSGFSAEGVTGQDAVINLREVLIRSFARMENQKPSEREDGDQFALLSSLIRRRKA